MTKKIRTKRKIITKKAKELFESQGYVDTKIKMITDAAGFKNQASFYRYFSSKEELGVLVTREFTQRIIEYMDEVLKIQDPDLRLTLHELLVYELIITDPSASRFIYELSRVVVSPATVMLNIEYTALIGEVLKYTSPNLTEREYENHLVFFTSGATGLYMAAIDKIRQNKIQTFQEILEIFLSNLKIDKKTQERLNDEAINIYNQIFSEKLNEFSLL